MWTYVNMRANQNEEAVVPDRSGAGKSVKARGETHLCNRNIDLHIWWQLQIRLETSHHGNQQMNGGQGAFVVDD